MSTDWSDCLLGDVITLKRGYDLPHRERIDGKVPIVSSSGVTGYHHEAKVHGPGVVTGRYGTLGEVFYIEEDFWPLNTALYVQDFKGNDPRFVSYFLWTLNLGQQNAAGAVPGVNRNHLHKLRTRVPPLQVQRKIAAVLSAYDDLIENNTRRIAILEEMARRLYREWFVHFRFPGHEDRAMVEVEGFGRVPEGWQVVKLETLAEVNAETIGKGNAPEHINYINISSVSTGAIEQVELLEFAHAPSRARRVVKHGDIIWSTVRPNRKSYALVVHPASDTIVSTGFAVISAQKTRFTYLYHALTLDDFAEYLTNRATGSAYPAVNQNDFKEANVLLPPLELVEAFHNIVVNEVELKHNLLKKNANLRGTRDLLLPRLISGELDLLTLDIATNTTSL